MGTWAGIKHALNSTLGTADFKPLNELLNDLIVEQTRMIASDELYTNLDGAVITAEPNATVDYILPWKLKMTRYGTMKLTGKLTRAQVLNQRGWFYIYKNNEEVFQWYRNWETGDSSETFSINVSFEPADIIEFRLMTTNASSLGNLTLSLGGFAMYGTVEHSVFLTV